MTVQEQIDDYISEQPQPKRAEMHELHGMITGLAPDARLWFLDGKNDEGKVVSNPNIGYGETSIRYASGEERAFYKIGLSANTAGISIYVMGIGDRKFLSERYGHRLGKAKISGYCIKFRSIDDIDRATLADLIADHLNGGKA